MSRYESWGERPDKRQCGISKLEEQYDKIYRYCYYKLKQRELAEDITQETFLRFLNQERYRDIGFHLPCLYRIAHNLCVDEFRRKKPVGLLGEEMVEDVTAQERMFSVVSVRMALAALDEEEREMILLRYVNEEPVSVICELFHLSRYAVYRKTTKALKKLKKELKE